MRTHVSVIRKALGDAAVVTHGAGWVIGIDQIDVARFEAAVATGRDELRAGDAEAALRAFDTALDVWRGPPELPDTPRGTAVATRWTEVAHAVAEDRWDALLGSGRSAEVVPQLELAVAEAPLRERRWAQLMVALYRSGRQGDALRAYRRARATLLEELGVDPGLELRQLESAILAHDPELDHGAASWLAAPVVIHNAPTPRNRFVGRVDELHRVAERIGARRPLTIVGPGGCGKTRLADEAGRKLADRFSDGVWFVSLAPIDDPKRVAEATCGALGVREQPGSTMLEALCHQVAGQRMLIVVDSCEHVVAGAADVVASLAEHVAVVATSRCPLGIRDEVLLRLGTLATPPVDAAADELLDSDAARLFLDRARLADPAFRPNAVTAPDVAEICRKVEGLPLALELAAARVRALGARQILGRLTDALNAARGAGREEDRRHQTLNSTIDWSVDLLDPPSRALYRRLAVFRGGWTLAGAEDVCADVGAHGAVAGGDVLSLLSELIDQSLVAADDTGTGEHRYRMLQVIRDHASGQLDRAGERDGMAQAHFDHFDGLAAELEVGADAGDPDACARLDAEADNLVAALAWGYGHEQSARAAQLAVRLTSWWVWRGRPSEAIDWLERGLAAVPAVPESTMVGLHATRSLAALLRSDAGTVLAHTAAAIDLARRVGPPDMFVKLLWLRALALTLSRAGLAEVDVLLREAVSVAEAHGDRGAVARVTSVGGRVAYLRGDLDKAKELLEQSRTIARRSELTMPLVLSTNYLAVVCALLDDGEGCRSLAREIADRARSSLPAHLRQQCRSGLLHAAAALRDPGLADHAEPSITVASWRALSQQVIAELVEQGRDADVYEIVLFTLLLADSADRPEMAAVLDGFFSRHTGWVEISPQEVERRQLAVDRARHAIGAERYERLHEIGQLFSVDQLLSSIADDREADQLLAK